MPLRDRQLDFEDFSSDTEKLSAILKRTETSSQKHKLAYEYYRARKFLVLLPSLLSCMCIALLGFLVTTDAIKRHMKVGDAQVEDLLTILIGCLGVFVGMMILMGNQWDFGRREGMHLSAMVDLEGLGDRIRFSKMNRAMNEEREGKSGSGSGSNGAGTGSGASVSSGRSADYGGERKALGTVENSDRKLALVVASGKTLKKVESAIEKKTKEVKKANDSRSDVARFSGYNATFNQINISCKSTIPLPISRPFDLFESRLECMSLGHLGVIWDTRMRRNQIMRLAAVEIYNEISGYWLWPFDTPDIDKVIDRSMKRVARLVSKDYRAPVKVECCGFTIFRCCCRKKNPKSGILHTLFDGIEDREIDMMEARQVGDYIDSGQRRFYDDDDGEYLLEDEVYAGDKMRYLQDSRGYAGGMSVMEEDDYTESSASGYSRSAKISSRPYSSSRGGTSSVRGSSRSRGMLAGGASVRTEHSGASQSVRSKRSQRGVGDSYSLSAKLSRNQATPVGWDEASESQYGP